MPTSLFPCAGIAHYNSFYGRGSSIYTWGNVVGGCIGNESMLLYCPRNPSAYTCSRDELAGVQCSIPCKVMDTDVDMQLHVCMVQLC